jgi:hypothetical protein
VRREVESTRGNIKAIELLKKLEADARNSTPEEKKVLAQHTGWDPFPAAKFEPDPRRRALLGLRLASFRRFPRFSDAVSN